MSDSILQVNQIKDKGGNATGITVADTSANISIGTTLAVNTINEVTSANGVTIDGLSLKDGNVAPASGKGIDFSAASGSAGGSSSALLDDYEEGTWTPAFLTGSTYYTQQGNYIKIGRLVICQYLLNNNAALSGGSANTQITGWPFAIPNIAYNGTLSQNGVNMNGRHILLRRYSSSGMGMIGSDHNGNGWAWIQDSVFGTNKDVFGTVIYFTS